MRATDRSGSRKRPDDGVDASRPIPRVDLSLLADIVFDREAGAALSCLCEYGFEPDGTLLAMITPKEVVTEWAAAFNRRDAAAAAALYHDDAENIQIPWGEPVRGRQAMCSIV